MLSCIVTACRFAEFVVIEQVSNEGEQCKAHAYNHYTVPLPLMPCSGSEPCAGAATDEITEHVHGVEAVLGTYIQGEESGLVHDVHGLQSEVNENDTDDEPDMVKPPSQKMIQLSTIISIE